jgi:two-component system phosphate regulon sensor histidine kinase PhoR
VGEEKRVFETFVRLEGSDRKGGTGLGLAIVKHIISRHQGRLAIESKLGEGSTFTVFLPAARQEMAQKPAVPVPVTEML